jgi:thiol:disulfide interchange protein DsbD
MGALSALVVTACVAPALIAALSVISQTGQVVRGAAALYATGLGMGVPLLIVGASAGSLLPRVGPWMDTVKALFGVLFLGVAIYFLQPLIPAAVGMLLWSVLAVIAGFWVFALKARDGGPAPAAVRAAGLLALVYGIILLIGVAAGSNDPLQPLSTLRASSNANGAGAIAAKESALAFETIKSVDDLNKRVAAATAAGRPVMLDFYADWCTSCKEMERYTFSDKTVQAALSNAVLLHADVTKNDPVDQQLLQHFGIFGPPTIAFYGPDGEERRNFRVVGYMKAAEFASLASRAFSPNLSASSSVPGAP